MKYWILKSEPTTYSWADLVRDKKTPWTGIRNYQARNNLRDMSIDDICFFYHSGKEKQIVGIAKVISVPYPDPTASDGNWLCVDIEASQELKHSISLSTIKSHKTLKEIVLAKHSRLSVSPITESDYQELIKLGS